MGAPDAGQRGDEIVDAFLELQPTQIHQLRRAYSGAAFGERPTGGVDSVADHLDLGEAGAEQFGDLIAHRHRTGDERVGFVNQPGLRRVHLATDATRHPP